MQRPFVPTVEQKDHLLKALRLPREEDFQLEEVTVATALAVENEGLVHPIVGRVDPVGPGDRATVFQRNAAPGLSPDPSCGMRPAGTPEQSKLL